jgi:hypothetical protein
MSKKIRLSIADPCQENWDAMNPVGNGRYCHSCQKAVVDFSTMSDTQLIAYFAKPASNLCGRFLPGQLDRTIAAPQRAIPWRPYLFGVALPAFLYSCDERVQGNIKATEKQETVEVRSLDGMLLKEPVPQPAFQRPTPTTCKEPMRQSYETPIVVPAEPEDCTDTTTLSNIVVTSYVQRRVMGRMMGGVSFVQSNTITDTIRKAVDTVRTAIDTLTGKRFSIYPNPASHGSLVRVDWKNCQPGDFAVEVISMAGQVVDRKVVSAQRGQILPLSLPELTPGTYLISFSNSRHRYAERLMIR